MQSADLKDRLVEYINNPGGSEDYQPARHASPDDTGDLYRGAGDIFTIGEDDAATSACSVHSDVVRIFVSDVFVCDVLFVFDVRV